MRAKPDVPDHEIERFMNFDNLLKDHNAAVTAMRWRMTIRITSAIVIVGAIGLAVYWFLPGQRPVATQHITPAADTTKIEEPVTRDTHAQVQLPLPAVSETENKKETNPESATPHREQKALHPAATPAPVPTEPVYVQAEPVDGYENLYEYFNRELQYPQEAMKDSVQGVVTVQFVIDNEGKPVNIRITKSLGEVFDTETIRLIQNMPGWTPATLNGKPVESKLSLPLTFNIQTIKHQP